MVIIWKVGAWPGVWKKNQKSRRKFASKYAIPYDFIAIGSGYLPDMTGWTFEKIKVEIDKLTEKTSNLIDIRANTVNCFVNEMKIEDIVLLYVNNQEVYIGEIKSDYYFVDKNSKLDFVKETTDVNYAPAPHRRDVSWKYKDKNNNAKSFSNIKFYSGEAKRAVYKIKEKDLIKVLNPEVKNYLHSILKMPYLISDKKD